MNWFSQQRKRFEEVIGDAAGKDRKIHSKSRDRLTDLPGYSSRASVHPQAIVDDLINRLEGRKATPDNLSFLDSLEKEARIRLKDHEFYLQDMLQTIQTLRVLMDRSK